MKVFIALAIFGIAAVAYTSAIDEPEQATPPTIDEPKCPAVNGENVTLIGNPANCTTYFACDAGVPVLMLCPAGLHFNDGEKACDWPNSACCDLSLDPENKCPKSS